MRKRKYKFDPVMFCGLPHLYQIALFHDKDGADHSFASAFCDVYVRTDVMLALAIMLSPDGRIFGSGFVSSGTFEKCLSTGTVWLHTGNPGQGKPDESEWIETNSRIQQVQVTEARDDGTRLSVIVFTVDQYGPNPKEVIHEIDFVNKSFTNGRGWTHRDGQDIE